MNIPVQQPFSYPHYVSVIVDSFCNHGDTRFEQIDCGGLRYDSNGELDYFEDYQPGEICNTCQAWHLEDAEWCGIEVMPMAHAFNTGKDIQDVTKLPF